MSFTAEDLDKLILKEQTLEDLDRKYYQTLCSDFPETEIRDLRSVKKYVRQGMYFCYELQLRGKEKEKDDREETNSGEAEKEEEGGGGGGNGNGGSYVGYAYFMKDPLSGWMLLDYLGVKEELRGLGYGSMFLTKILKVLGRKTYIFIEVEASEFPPRLAFDSHRQKRLDFYLKNGLLDTGVVVDTYTVLYSILIYKEEIKADEIPSKEDIGKLYLRLYKHILGYDTCKENVNIAFPKITVDDL